MQKQLLVTGLLCGAIFALQTEASQEQQKVVDVHAQLLEAPFIGQSGMIIPGTAQGSIHLKVPVQSEHFPTVYQNISDHLERVYPNSVALPFKDYSTGVVLLDEKLPYELKARKLQIREVAYLLSLGAIYQAVKQAYKPKKQ